jgi:hemolysin III
MKIEQRAILVDLAIQAIGLIVSLVGMAALIGWTLVHREGTVVTVVSVYAMTLVAMFACSLAYAAARGSVHGPWLRVCDHSAIYLLIAGSYTPICLLVIDGTSGRGLLAAIWATAAAGIICEIILRERVAWLTIALSLLMGWAVLVKIDVVMARLPPAAAVLFVSGGLLYTLGVPAHCYRRLPYNQAIWHLAVLAAAGCHYGAIALVVTGLGSQT